MRNLPILLVLAAGTTLAGCTTLATPSAPVDVTRFHLVGADGQIARGTIAVGPVTNAPADSQSFEFRSYAAAVAAELARIGYTPVAEGAATDFLARVDYTRGTQTADGDGGPGRTQRQVRTQLSVAIEHRADAAVVWEGRADMAADAGADPAEVTRRANKLAAALFKGFPGESGRTITVP
ncbi:MAG: DUF4136 domain-containing protein [Sphingomonadales bacterium]|nr:DUF4136 domain-containing protein [Sphingomonadales bacterium]